MHEFEILVVHATMYKLLCLAWCISFVYAHFSCYMGVILQFSIEWENADDLIALSRSSENQNIKVNQLKFHALKLVQDRLNRLLH